MSEPNYNLCDICGEKTPKEARIFFSTGVAPSALDNEEGQFLDLCTEHLVMALRTFIGFKEFSQTSAVLDKLRRSKKA